jgi:hypothetical protein
MIAIMSSSEYIVCTPFLNLPNNDAFNYKTFKRLRKLKIVEFSRSGYHLSDIINRERTGNVSSIHENSIQRVTIRVNRQGNQKWYIAQIIRCTNI